MGSGGLHPEQARLSPKSHHLQKMGRGVRCMTWAVPKKPTARPPAVTQASTCALNLNHQRRTSSNSYALHPCRASPRPSRHPDRSGGISRWPKPGNITGLRTPDSGPVPIPQSSTAESIESIPMDCRPQTHTQIPGTRYTFRRPGECRVFIWQASGFSPACRHRTGVPVRVEVDWRR
jgi:hypothetical protein